MSWFRVRGRIVTNRLPLLLSVVVYRRPVGELAVGDVQEVGPTGKRDELVPGRDVGDVVGGVAVFDPERDRDRTISGDREHAQQLFNRSGRWSLLCPGVITAVALLSRTVSVAWWTVEYPPDPVIVERGGPYYQWSRAVAAKTESRRLNEPDTDLYRQWIGNRRHLDQIITRMETLSAAASEILLREATAHQP